MERFLCVKSVEQCKVGKYYIMGLDQDLVMQTDIFIFVYEDDPFMPSSFACINYSLVKECFISIDKHRNNQINKILK